MQPTLYGITVDNQATPGLMDRVPFRYAKYLLTGRRYVDVRAKTSGVVAFNQDARTRDYFIVVGGKRHRFYRGMELYVSRGDYVSRGERLASGMVLAGDHIFVDKVRYNFLKPKRGHIVVFTTHAIQHPQIRQADHYIKRLAGMPGETISLDPPYLVADGERVRAPYAFERLVQDRPPYGGYAFARREDPLALLTSAAATVDLGPDEFLPLGDNTNHSLDGRYFGGVPLRNLMGPAFIVYWPFGSRWGPVR
jgi:signal peptidase I